jgi:transcriptional regulator with XRE-family HTH domain
MPQHPVDVHVGARLRLFRIERGMSQTEMAQGVGLTFQQVQKYEKGTNRVSASKLFEFARLLKVPVHAFFAGLEGEDPQPAPDMIRHASRLDYEIVGLLSRLDNSRIKQKLRAVLEALTAADEEAPTPSHSTSQRSPA